MSPTQTTQKQEGHQGRAVGLFVQGGQGDEGKADVEKAEDGGGGVGHHLLDRPEEGAVDQQAKGENAEDGGGAVGPLKVDAKERPRATSTAMRGGLAPPRSARPRNSHAASAATAATAIVKSQCQRGPRKTRNRTSGIRITAVTIRFIQG